MKNIAVQNAYTMKTCLRLIKTLFLYTMILVCCALYAKAESVCIVWGLDSNGSVSRTTEIYCLDDAGDFLDWNVFHVKTAGNLIPMQVLVPATIQVPAHDSFPAFAIPAGKIECQAELVTGSTTLYLPKNVADWLFQIYLNLNL